MAQKCQISRVKNWSKLESRVGPSMLRNIIGPTVVSRAGSFLTFFWSLFQISFSLQKEEHYTKGKNQKKKKRKTWTNPLTQERPFSDQSVTAENEALENRFLVFYLWHRLLGSSGCEAGTF